MSELVEVDRGVDLNEECEVFTRYLLDESPSAKVKASYVRAHEIGTVAPPEGVTTHDRVALALARRGGTWLKMADVNARFFGKGGYLRRKLVMLLALIETDAVGRRRADRPSGVGPWALFFRMALWGVVAASLLIVSVPVFWFAGRSNKAPQG